MLLLLLLGVIYVDVLYKMRDLKNIGRKLSQVLVPRPNRTAILRDCKCDCFAFFFKSHSATGDLWGPLLLCLTLAV